MPPDTATGLTEAQARDEICRVGRSLFERGYVHASAGNISVRLHDAHGGGFLITPTDACLGFLDPARLARLDRDLHQQSGDKASKTIALHARIYSATARFDAETRCVIHTHSTHCVQLSLLADRRTAAPADGLLPEPLLPELLPAITPYFVMKVGHVPLIPYHRPGAIEAAEAVAQAISRYGERGTPLRAVMLSRLGPNVWHDSPSAAMATLEELEETARLVCMSRLNPADSAAGALAPLTEAQIQALRDQFGARW
jgi:ribulose-5-phosphate 4-epimerase/fuculose-1-phosphate aldolase